MGRHDDADGGFDAGGDVTPRASLTPADQPLPHELGFSIGSLGISAVNTDAFASPQVGVCFVG